MNTELKKELKAAVLKNYAMLGLNMVCVAKTFQLPDKRLDGVLYNIRGDYALCLSHENHLDFFDIDEWVLPLRPLAAITDSEAVEVYKLYFNLEPTNSSVQYTKNVIESISDKAKCYQYLQQQGFALPVWFKGEFYSCERLIELGIYKIIDP